MLNNRPAGYVASRGGSPASGIPPHARPVDSDRDGRRFLGAADGFREPLVTMGGQHHHLLLYAEHTPGGLRLVSETGESTSTFDLATPEGSTTRLRVAYSPQNRTMEVAVNGQPVLRHEVPALVTAPSQVTIGKNRIAPDVTCARFTGRIEVLRKVVREKAPPAVPARLWKPETRGIGILKLRNGRWTNLTILATTLRPILR